MKQSPRIVVESVSLTGPDGKKYARKLKEGDSFSEAYWSLAYEAYGLASVKGKENSGVGDGTPSSWWVSIGGNEESRGQEMGFRRGEGQRYGNSEGG